MQNAVDIDLQAPIPPHGPFPKQGRLKTRSFASLLRQALEQRVTGILECTKLPARRQIYFWCGYPTEIRSNMLHETLPGFLLHKKKIPTSVYNACIQADPRTLKAQNILLDSGYLDQDTLLHATETLNFNLLEACISWDIARFRFTALNPSRALKARIEINIVRTLAGWMLRWFPPHTLNTRLHNKLPVRFELSATGILHRQRLHDDMALVSSLAFTPELSLDLSTPPQDPAHIAWLLAAYDLGFFNEHNAITDTPENLSSIDDALNALSRAEDHTIESLGQDEFAATLQDIHISNPIHTHIQHTLLQYLEDEWQRLSDAPSAHTILGVPADAQPATIRSAFQRLSRFFQPEHFDFTDDPETILTLRNCRRVLKSAVRALLPDTINYSSRSSSSHRFISQDPNWEEDIVALAALFFLDGLTFLKLKQHKEALEHFQEAHDRHPRNASYLAYIGWTRFLIAVAPEAIHEAKITIRSAMRIDPNLDTPYTMLGHIARREKQTDTARALYMQALSLNPDNSDARAGLLRITTLSSNNNQPRHTPKPLHAIKDPLKSSKNS